MAVSSRGCSAVRNAWAADVCRRRRTAKTLSRRRTGGASARLAGPRGLRSSGGAPRAGSDSRLRRQRPGAIRRHRWRARLQLLRVNAPGRTGKATPSDTRDSPYRPRRLRSRGRAPRAVHQQRPDDPPRLRSHRPRRGSAGVVGLRLRDPHSGRCSFDRRELHDLGGEYAGLGRGRSRVLDHPEPDVQRAGRPELHRGSDLRDELQRSERLPRLRLRFEHECLDRAREPDLRRFSPGRSRGRRWS